MFCNAAAWCALVSCGPHRGSRGSYTPALKSSCHAIDVVGACPGVMLVNVPISGRAAWWPLLSLTTKALAPELEQVPSEFRKPEQAIATGLRPVVVKLMLPTVTVSELLVPVLPFGFIPKLVWD